MPYCTAHTDLIYAAAHGVPAVCRYRCLVTGNAASTPRIIVQIEETDRTENDLQTNYNSRDAVINRILDRELAGVPLDLIDVVLSESDQHVTVALTADIEDYIQRGNPYKLTPAPGRRGRAFEKISIDSSQLVAGRVRVHSGDAPPAPTSADLVALINAV